MYFIGGICIRKASTNTTISNLSISDYISTMENELKESRAMGIEINNEILIAEQKVLDLRQQKMYQEGEEATLIKAITGLKAVVNK